MQADIVPSETQNANVAGRASLLQQLPHVFASGCFAGAVQCIVTVPQELLKIKMQVIPSPQTINLQLQWRLR